MEVATGIMVGIAIILSIVAYTREPSILLAGLKGGGITLLQIMPLLLAAFVIGGLAQVLVPREFITKWLGAESGMRGVILGCLAGALTPGGPYISLPIAAAIYQAGAGVGTVVGFITAWSLWSLSRIPMEVALLGPKVALFRFASTLIFPPIVGFIAQVFFQRFVQ